MISRLHKGDAENGERTSEQTGSSQVIPIGDARRAAAGRGVSYPAPLEKQLEEVQEYLDRGLPSAADTRLRQIISHAKRDPNVLARARRLHSITLEALGRFHDSLEAVFTQRGAAGVNVEGIKSRVSELLGSDVMADVLGDTALFKTLGGSAIERAFIDINTLTKACQFYKIRFENFPYFDCLRRSVGTIGVGVKQNFPSKLLLSEGHHFLRAARVRIIVLTHAAADLELHRFRAGLVHAADVDVHLLFRRGVAPRP